MFILFYVVAPFTLLVALLFVITLLFPQIKPSTKVVPNTLKTLFTDANAHIPLLPNAMLLDITQRRRVFETLLML